MAGWNVLFGGFPGNQNQKHEKSFGTKTITIVKYFYSNIAQHFILTFGIKRQHIRRYLCDAD